MIVNLDSGQSNSAINLLVLANNYTLFQQAVQAVMLYQHSAVGLNVRSKYWSDNKVGRFTSLHYGGQNGRFMSVHKLDSVVLVFSMRSSLLFSGPILAHFLN